MLLLRCLSHIKSCSNKSKGTLKNTCNNMALAWFIWILVSIHELWGSCSKDIPSYLGAQDGAICFLGTEKLIHFCTIHSSCWDHHGPHHHRASLGCFAKGETRLWMWELGLQVGTWDPNLSFLTPHWIVCFSSKQLPFILQKPFDRRPLFLVKH